MKTDEFFRENITEYYRDRLPEGVTLYQVAMFEDIPAEVYYDSDCVDVDKIIERLENGDHWAHHVAALELQVPGLENVVVEMGGLSFYNAEGLFELGYFEELLDEALDELHQKAKALKE